MKPRQIFNVLALLMVLVVNWLAEALPLNGQTTGQISDSIPTLFTPAGYVFSIWGVIYLWLIAFAVFQILPSQKNANFVGQIGWWFVASCVLNAAWIFLWHYESFVWTLVAMAGLLVSLLAIYQRLEIGRCPVPTAIKWLVHVPFSIYLGWVSVATIANVSVVLVESNWSGWGLSPVVWTVIVILVGGGLGALMIRRRNEIAYPLVIVWAFAGIVVKQQAAGAVAYAAAGVAVALVLLLIYSRWLEPARPAGAC